MITLGTPTSAETTTSTLEVPKPSVSVGDLILLFAFAEANSGAVPSFTFETGFTELLDFNDDGGSTSRGAGTAVAYRVVDGTEASTLTVDSPYSSQDFYATAVPVSGIDGTSPIDVTGAWGDTGGALDVIAPGVTTTQDGCLAITFAAMDGADASPASSTAGWSTLIDGGYISDGVTGRGVAYHVSTKAIASLGATGDNTVTFSSSDGGMAAMFAVAPGSGDSTAPVLSSPTADAVGSTVVTPKVTTDEGNGTIYAYVTAAGTDPSAATIKASGASQTVSGTGVQTFTQVTGLTSETNYQVSFVHDDAATNESNVVRVDFTTTDVTAPTLSSATAVSVGVTTVTPRVTTDEGNGTIYAYVTAAGTDPSAATIKASGDSQAVSGTGAQTFTQVTGLTADTNYQISFVHDDSSSNESNVVRVNFTTDPEADVTPPVLSVATYASLGAVAVTPKVTTDEGNGTVYAYITDAGTDPVAATIIASGISKEVIATGVQTFAEQTGLVPAHDYQISYVHVDSATNQSNVVRVNFTTTNPVTVYTVDQAKPETEDKSTLDLSGCGIGNEVEVPDYTLQGDTITWNDPFDGTFVINNSTGTKTFQARSRADSGSAWTPYATFTIN